jgi:DnaJ-class molecular chaperone
MFYSGMKTDDHKQEIRRRIFAERRRAGEPSGDLAAFFTTCPECQGRGKVCIESPTTACLNTCPRCAGDGFVAKDET